jgi:nonsense-mediated mRNA decay protein 3
VTVEVCRYCGSIRLGSRWVPASSFEEAVLAIAQHLVRKAKPIEPLESVELVGVDYESLPNWLTRIRLHLRGSYRGVEIEGFQTVEIKLKPSVCPVCKIRVSGEYDTLVQVRGGDPEEIERVIEAEIVKNDLLPHFVDIIRGKHGVDVYFTHQGAARKLTRALSRYYEIEVHTPVHENVGIESTGKRRSRKTIVIRLGRRINKI